MLNVTHSSNKGCDSTRTGTHQLQINRICRPIKSKMAGLLRRQSTSDLATCRNLQSRSMNALDRSHSKTRSKGRVDSQKAMEQLERMQLNLQSATAAFSAAGRERRTAFQQRKWYTIAGLEAGHPARRISSDVGPDACRQDSASGSINDDVDAGNDNGGGMRTEQFLSTPRIYNRKEKSVSFEDEHAAYPSRQSTISRLDFFFFKFY